MNHLLLLFTGIFWTVDSVQAQSVPIHLTVKNEQTGKPLAFAMAYSANLKTGRYTTEEGKLDWALEPNYTITVSFLSYEAQTIPVRFLLNAGEILLKETAYTLGAIDVKAHRKRRKTVRIGFYDDPTEFDGWGANIGTTFVNNIYNTTRQAGHLKTFLVDTGKARSKPHRALARLRVFAADKAVRGPGRDLLTENIVFRIPKFSTHLKIDISQYNIAFPPEGLFVGLEFLGFETKDGLNTTWKQRNGANVTSTRRDDYRSVGESWRFPDSNGRPRWICISDASQHKAWERTLLKIGADVDVLE